MKVVRKNLEILGKKNKTKQSTATKVKNTFDRHIVRVNTAKERICELGDKMTAIAQPKINKKEKEQDIQKL